MTLTAKGFTAVMAQRREPPELARLFPDATMGHAGPVSSCSGSSQRRFGWPRMGAGMRRRPHGGNHRGIYR